MEKLYSNIVGMPVFLDEGRQAVNTVKDIVMNSETGKLLAFVVNKRKGLIIMERDVLQWGDVLHIHGHEDVVEAEDIVKVKNVLERGVRIFGNKVETKDGREIGMVVDMAVDNKSFSLKKIFVAKRVLGLLQYDQRIIPAGKIVEVLEDKVVVESDVEVLKDEASAAEMAAA